MTLTRIALLALLSAAVSVSAEPTTDVRVLIDVSGSMKDNDPANLRVPALQLLNGLMPLGARGGIWMFAEAVEQRLAHGVVDEAWKRGARDAAGAVHWRGQRTDIEAALRAAATGWQTPDPDSRRSIILLTDGMVDTGSAATSAASRAQILEQGVAALAASGAAVHAIALSAQADHDLLRSLAIRTGGWYERADDAGQLERLFLRMFEKAAEPDTVPITGNRFSVDGSIDEMTVLVFRAPDGPKLQLLAPEGVALSSVAPGEGAVWRTGNGYDMVTIRQPAQGQWQIDGEADPDNRVMVITDLKLEVEGLPSYVMPGTTLRVAASLSEAGQRVVRADFLQLVGVNTVREAVDGVTSDLVMLDDGDGGDLEAGDGRFGTNVDSGGDEGVVQVTVTADSGTFIREKRFSIEVVWPVATRVEAGTPRQLLVTPRADVIDTATMVVQASLAPAGGEERPLTLVADTDGVLRGELVDSDAGAKVRITLAARTLAGDMLELSLPTVDVEPLVSLPVVAPASKAEMVAATDRGDAPEPLAPAPTETSPPNWRQATILAVAANLVAGVLLFTLLWWRARSRKLQLAVIETALSPAA